MSAKKNPPPCVVLAQKRNSNEYNDLVGVVYHFPRKYRNTLREEGLSFVYYDPESRSYFGSGVIGKVVEDKREDDHYFVTLDNYRPFSTEVPFLDDKGVARETGPSYNPQNHVRFLSREEFDGICLDAGLLLSFQADAHLMKVLGEELIASEVVGILELVKNSFDAGAQNCCIRILKIPGFPNSADETEFNDLEGPIIIIEDDGKGMTLDEIKFGWMRPASVIKTNIKEQIKRERRLALESDSLGTYESLITQLKKAHGGRIPLGEKGVGRFATHRLGQQLLLTTKTVNNDYEALLTIDWKKFDCSAAEGPVNLNDISSTLSRQPPSRDYGPNKSGTRLIISGGRSGFELNHDTIHEINRSILRLQSPQKTPDSFRVAFECPQMPDLDETPLTDTFTPNFTYDILINEQGVADLEWSFNPPSSIPLPSESRSETIDLKQLDRDSWKLPNNQNVWRNPTCGSFLLHLDVWYRSKPWIDGPFVRAFQQHLESFGGISIYRDGMNILPAEWGTKVDWLGLSKRQIKKTLNLSYYNMVGNLEIDQTTNIQITDKTDREGVLDNQAFRDLSLLTKSVILYIENSFKGKRDQFTSLTSGLRRKPQDLEPDATAASDLITSMVDKYNVCEDPSGFLEAFGTPDERHDRLVNLRDSLKNLKKSLAAMEEVQDQLTERAGYGLSMGVAVHEIAKITANFYSVIVNAMKEATVSRETLAPLQESAQSLKQEITRLGPFRAVRNESLRSFSVRKSLEFVIAVFNRRLVKHNISCRLIGDDFKVFARYGALNQVISNLLDNSVYWVTVSNLQQNVIEINVDSKRRTIVIGDSGPGLSSAIRAFLFEPGYSLRQPPSGLGLYICKYYMRSFGGDIYECPITELLIDVNGAQFCLDFSRVKEGGEPK